jgi:hypothetical protein
MLIKEITMFFKVNLFNTIDSLFSLIIFNKSFLSIFNYNLAFKKISINA